MLTIPSFSSEWTVYVVGDEGGPSQVVFKNMRADRAVYRVVAPISQSTAELLDQVWVAMLARVRYPVPGGVLMLDGTTYHVSHFQYGVGERAGKTWSPMATSNTGRLVAIAETLRRFATREDRERAAAETYLVREAKELLARLKTQP